MSDEDNKMNDENIVEANVAEEQMDSFVDEVGIMPIQIEDEMKKSYIDYSMSVIVGRALPDARDGMKPVHRRCIFVMGETNNVHSQPHRKSARVVGDVMGKYHPHGDSSIYETIVRMAQPFAMRYCLVDGHGNFGSIDGDGAAAMRYTEVRMQRYAEDMLEDLDKETVDMVPNYDETLEEPTVLPTKLPNLLLNGSMGIAVGMATNIPTHNLTELCDAIKLLIDKPNVTILELMQHVKGPDFPTGGIICGVKGIHDMYTMGRGSICIRGRAEIENDSKKKRIIIKEIPYNVNKAEMVAKMGLLASDKKNERYIEGIKDIRDVSSKGDIRIEIDLKQEADPEVVLNLLYKHTPLQSSFGANMLALDHGRPKVMTLKQFLRCFVDHRIEVITRRTRFDLRKAKERVHILEGFRIAIDNMDEIVRIIRASRDDKEATVELNRHFGLDDIQCHAILEMKLRQLTGLARDKVENEYREKLALIEELTYILETPQKVLDIIKEDCDELKVKYGDERRTEITNAEGDVDIEDLIPNIPVVISLSNAGYVKRTSMSDFREQRKGGTGKKGAKLKEDDFVMKVYNCKAHDKLLFFTSHGRLFCSKAYRIPEAECNSLGRPLQNIINLRPKVVEKKDDNGVVIEEGRAAERVLDILVIEEFKDDQSVFFATRKGIVKRTLLSEFKNVHKGGINAINIDNDDELIGAELVQEEDEMLLITANGLSARFKVKLVRNMGRAARGVRGIRLRGVKLVTDDIVSDNEPQETDTNDADDSTKGMGADELRAMVKVDNTPDTSMLIIVENGYGKCTPFEEYPCHNRGGKGVKGIITNERNGKVVFAGSVNRGHEVEGTRVDDDSLLVMTQNGLSIRMAAGSISEMHRSTQGSRIVRLREGDKVVSATIIDSSLADESDRLAADAQQIDVAEVTPSEN